MPWSAVRHRPVPNVSLSVFRDGARRHCRHVPRICAACPCPRRAAIHQPAVTATRHVPTRHDGAGSVNETLPVGRGLREQTPHAVSDRPIRALIDVQRAGCRLSAAPCVRRSAITCRDARSLRRVTRGSAHGVRLPSPPSTRGGRRGCSAVAASWSMVSIARWSALDALHDAHFRRLWLAGLCVNVGRWLDFLVLGWLVLELTGSPFMVGVAAFCRFAPMIVLGLFAGLLIDRVPRGRLLVGVQSVNFGVRVAAGHPLRDRPRRSLVADRPGDGARHRLGHRLPLAANGPLHAGRPEAGHQRRLARERLDAGHQDRRAGPRRRAAGAARPGRLLPGAGGALPRRPPADPLADPPGLLAGLAPDRRVDPGRARDRVPGGPLAARHLRRADHHHRHERAGLPVPADPPRLRPRRPGDRAGAAGAAGRRRRGRHADRRVLDGRPARLRVPPPGLRRRLDDGRGCWW